MRNWFKKTFKKTFGLSKNLDTNSIEASYLNGILTIKFTEEKVKETVKKIKIS